MSVLDPALEAVVRISTPLLFAALGELVLERSGIINIGIEGVMLTGAFSGFCGAYFTHSPVAGAVAGALGGMLLMMLFALLVLRFLADQIVVGMAVNLIAIGLTATIYRTMPAGINAPTFGAVVGNSQISGLGPALLNQTPLTWLALLLAPLIYYYLNKSERGMELRAVGGNPDAAEASGVAVFA